MLTCGKKKKNKKLVSTSDDRYQKTVFYFENANFVFRRINETMTLEKTLHQYEGREETLFKGTLLGNTYHMYHQSSHHVSGMWQVPSHQLDHSLG